MPPTNAPRAPRNGPRRVCPDCDAPHYRLVARCAVCAPPTKARSRPTGRPPGRPRGSGRINWRNRDRSK